MPEKGKALLQVHGYRVVHFRAHIFGFEIGLQFVTALNTDDVLVEDVTRGDHLRKEDLRRPAGVGACSHRGLLSLAGRADPQA